MKKISQRSFENVGEEAARYLAILNLTCYNSCDLRSLGVREYLFWNIEIAKRIVENEYFVFDIIGGSFLRR